VALMPQWRQDYPDDRPPAWATAISAVGQLRPPALRNMIAKCPLPGAPEIVVDFSESCQPDVPKSVRLDENAHAIGRHPALKLSN
jgi:hypothetical protein